MAATRRNLYFNGPNIVRFHLRVKMIPVYHFLDEDIRKRFEAFYGDSREFAEGQIPYWREKLSSLSEFVREIKAGFVPDITTGVTTAGAIFGVIVLKA